MEPQIGGGHRYTAALANEVGGSVYFISDSFTQEVSSYRDDDTNGKTLWSTAMILPKAT